MFYSEKVDKTVILYLCAKNGLSKDMAEKILKSFISTKMAMLENMKNSGKI